MLQEKFGINKNLIVYSNEKLIRETDKVMSSFANNLNIDFNKNLCNPTIGKLAWGGNSHYGKSKGINENTLENYKKVLKKEEINLILKETQNLRSAILDQDETLLNLTKVNEKYFSDYYYQQKYFNQYCSFYIIIILLILINLFFGICFFFSFEWVISF